MTQQPDERIVFSVPPAEGVFAQPWSLRKVLRLSAAFGPAAIVASVAIGAVLVFPFNAMDAFAAGNPIVVALTMGTTIATNPFYGLVMGIVVKVVMGWLGVL